MDKKAGIIQLADDKSRFICSLYYFRPHARTVTMIDFFLWGAKVGIIILKRHEIKLLHSLTR